MSHRLRAVAILACVLFGCGSDSPLDAVPPFGVVDLRATAVFDTAVVLTWTAPGDDDRRGRAAVYDVRYAAEPIADSTWNRAVPVGGPPPEAAGSREVHRVNGLDRSSEYYFVLRTIDETGNESSLSNVVRVNTREAPIEYESEWGAMGSEPGRLLFPRGLDADNRSRIFVADERNDRVQRFSSGGQVQIAVGTYGTSPGQFQGPFGVAVDSSGNFFVTDQGNHRVQKFSSSGMYDQHWGEAGAEPGNFQDPLGIAVSGDTVFVADSRNERIQLFDLQGTYLSALTAPDAMGWTPVGVHPVGTGVLYVTDSRNQRVLKLRRNGSLLAQWGGPGSGPGQFNLPMAVLEDLRGNVLVVDQLNHRIQGFTPEGRFLFETGFFGTGDGQFNRPHDIVLGLQEIIFVTDTGNHRVQRFTYLESLPVTP